MALGSKRKTVRAFTAHLQVPDLYQSIVAVDFARVFFGLIKFLPIVADLKPLDSILNLIIVEELI